MTTKRKMSNIKKIIKEKALGALGVPKPINSSAYTDPGLPQQKRVKLVEYSKESSTETETASESQRQEDGPLSSPDNSPVRKTKQLFNKVAVNDRGCLRTGSDLINTAEPIPTPLKEDMAATNNGSSSGCVKGGSAKSCSIKDVCSLAEKEVEASDIPLVVPRKNLPIKDVVLDNLKIIELNDLPMYITEEDIHENLEVAGLEAKSIHFFQKEGSSKQCGLVEFYSMADANDWMGIQRGVVEMKGVEVIMMFSVQNNILDKQVFHRPLNQKKDNMDSIDLNEAQLNIGGTSNKDNDSEVSLDLNMGSNTTINTDDIQFIIDNSRDDTTEFVCDNVLEENVGGSTMGCNSSQNSRVSINDESQDTIETEVIVETVCNVNNNVDIPDGAIVINQELLSNHTSSSSELDPSIRKLTRKRISQPNTWKQNIRIAKRNKGEEYINTKGKLKKPRPIEACSNCRFNCTEKIGAAEQQNLRESYNQLKDGNAKKSYLCHLVQEFDCNSKSQKESPNQGKARKFYKYCLPIGNTLVKVCRSFFCGTFGIHSHHVSYLFQHNVDSETLTYLGRKTSENNRRNESKKDHCRLHIGQLPTVESHYRRAESKKEYLETQCNSISKCYKKFKEWMIEKGFSEDDIASESIYRIVFNTEFNLAFHKPKNDICHVCFLYRTKKTNNNLSQDEAENFEKHLRDKNRARLEKNKDDEEGKHQLAFDLMNTTSLPLTKVGSVFYMSHLTVYNLTVVASIPFAKVTNETTDNLINVNGPEGDINVAESRNTNITDGDGNINVGSGGEAFADTGVANTDSHISGGGHSNATGGETTSTKEKKKFYTKGYSATWNESHHGRDASDLSNGLYRILLSHDEQYKPQDLTLWSDSPTGQNRNSIMTAMLKHFLAGSSTLKTITHKFGFANHNFMQKVDTYHSKMERTTRNEEVWTYEELTDYWAQHTVVEDMMSGEMLNFGDMAKDERLNFKNIPYSKVCAMKYEKDDSFGIKIKLETFENEWERVSIRKFTRRKARGKGETEVTFPQPVAVVSVPRKLSVAKIDAFKNYIKFLDGDKKKWLEDIIKKCS